MATALVEKKYSVKTPFVVLSMMRSGSSLLRLALCLHQDILMLGELYHMVNPFHPDKGCGKPEAWMDQIRSKSKGNVDEKVFGFTAASCDRKHQRPHDAEFLQTLWNKVDYTVPAVGFKVFHDHLDWQRQEDLFISDPEVKVIVLHRRNILDKHISREMARGGASLGGGWDPHEIHPRDKQVSFQPAVFRELANTTDAYYSFISEALMRHNKQAHYVYYEPLSDDQHIRTVVMGVAQFLGVDASTSALQPFEQEAFQKTEAEDFPGQTQAGVTQRDKVDNYEEMRVMLKGSEYEKYIK